MFTADGEAADTPLRIFTQNTMPLSCLGLFFHNLWDTYASYHTCPKDFVSNRNISNILEEAPSAR